ncbi:alanine racemase C-terminal domain-containing protein, partial [Weissella soli]|uniref:alanine racemase C-terminal domain-containing protein n=1 Tax=Weissella soli TaxID=155866 RepID=UPI00359FD34D
RVRGPVQDNWLVVLAPGMVQRHRPRCQQDFGVIINGQRARIVGQIAMDQLMVSLPEEVPVGTKVTFIGKNGGLENTLEDFSDHAGLAPWVVTTSLQERIKRELVD